jgi:NAD-dependent DNA ligase
MPTFETPKVQTSILTGKTIVFTGESDIYTRSDLKRMAEQHGAFVRNAISGKTNYLIVGENPGDSKLRKAESDFPDCEIVDIDFLLGVVA